MRALLVVLFSALFHLSFQQAPSSKTVIDKEPLIQIALLLDTSNSMDGLIDQAKSQLWKLVNELATSTKNNQNPRIEIALYEYGNDNLAMHEGYIRQVVALTEDLDEISRALFELTTNGGSEYCGQVISDALDALKWSDDKNDLRLIAIAGNEPFNQGPVSPKSAYAKACEKEVAVTTIYCGDWNEGIRTGWKDAPACVSSKYLNIDQDDRVAHIPTPYDQELVALNQALNQTYLAFGRSGSSKMENQAMQDINAASYSSANLRERALFKAKKQYTNASWDLVDAATEEKEILERLEESELPEEMKGLSKEEQIKFLDEKKKERQAIRENILILDEKIKQYIAEQKKEEANQSANTLDAAMLDAVHQLAKEKEFNFQK